LLRVGGRIHKAELPEEEKHPIILSSDHPAVELFVQDIHRREMHAGVEHTLSVVRQRFWLIKGSATIRKYSTGGVGNFVESLNFRVRAADKVLEDHLTKR
jgi:hypothetical protein